MPPIVNAAGHAPGADPGPVPGPSASPGTTSAPASGGMDTSDDFSGLLAPESSEDMESAVAAPLAAEVTEAPAPAAVPLQGPQPIPPAQQAVPVPPAAEPVQGRAQVAPPVDFVQLMRQNRDALAGEVATQLYQLRQEDVDALSIDPGSATARLAPLMAGRIHTEVMMAVHQIIRQLVPGIVQNTTRQSTMAQQYDATFTHMWPALTQEHVPMLRTLATTYKQTHPNATPAEGMKAIGRMAYAVLGMPLPAAGQTAASVQAVASANGARPVPFTPARGGVAPSNNVEENQFAGLFRDYD